MTDYLVALQNVARLALKASGGRRAVNRLALVAERDGDGVAAAAIREVVEPAVATVKRRGPSPVAALVAGRSLTDGEKRTLGWINWLWAEKVRRESVPGGGGYLPRVDSRGAREPAAVRFFDNVGVERVDRHVFAPWLKAMKATGLGEHRRVAPGGGEDCVHDVLHALVVLELGLREQERLARRRSGAFKAEVRFALAAFAEGYAKAEQEGQLNTKSSGLEGRGDNMFDTGPRIG